MYFNLCMHIDLRWERKRDFPVCNLRILCSAEPAKMRKTSAAPYLTGRFESEYLKNSNLIFKRTGQNASSSVGGCTELLIYALCPQNSFLKNHNKNISLNLSVVWKC